MTARKIRVAILGGGCGGMAAAFWLSSSEALRDRFEVTVYQRGWRLGGKGASGRNAAQGRIEEHGLHMWLGCYENAFRTMRACYDAWAPRRESPFRCWRDAFAPQTQIVFTQVDHDQPHGWSLWKFPTRARSGTPGDGEPLTWADRLFGLANWLGKRLHPDGDPVPDPFQRVLAHIVHALVGVAMLIAVALRALVVLATVVLRPFAKTKLLSRYSIVADLVVADLALTASIGIARDILPWGVRGFERINAYDFREWLRRHGATRRALECAPLRAIYDLAFAYPNGDPSNMMDGRGAAGAGLRFLLEWGLAYKGAPLWKMNAGMGDVVFTPLYQVLKARDVEFRFFHDVREIRLDVARRRVGSIVLRKQADPIVGTYEPFVVVGGLDCWPSAPIWDRLVDGEELRRSGIDFESWNEKPHGAEQTLHADSDFDLVVLAFPPEMIRRVAPELAEANGRFKTMIDRSASVATQAFQLWLRPTLPELGWKCGEPVLSGYASPFSTWADMSHLLEREHWSEPYAPATIAYFCGVLAAESATSPECERSIEYDAGNWLKKNAALLWPVKFPFGARPEPDVIVSSHFRCNVDPSERYVLTLPGSVNYRIASNEPLFENLYLAGDWTTTRYSSGCVESAVESGMLAARAIGGEPAIIYGH